MRFNLKTALLTASALVVVGSGSVQAEDLIVNANDGVELVGDADLHSAADNIIFSANDSAQGQLTLVDDDYHFNNVSGTAGGEFDNIIRIVGDTQITTLEIYGDVIDNSADGEQDARITFSLEPVNFPTVLTFSRPNAQIDADILSDVDGAGNVYFVTGANETIDFRGRIGDDTNSVGEIYGQGDGITVLHGNVYADMVSSGGEYTETPEDGLVGGAVLFGGNVTAATGLILDNPNGAAFGFGVLDSHTADVNTTVDAKITTMFNGQGVVAVMGGETLKSVVTFNDTIGSDLFILNKVAIENNAKAIFNDEVHALSLNFVGQDPDYANDEQGAVYVANSATINANIVIEGNATGHMEFEGDTVVNGSIMMDDGFAIDLSNPLNPVSGRFEVVANADNVSFDGGASGRHKIYGQFAVVGTNGANVELVSDNSVEIDGIAQISMLGGGHLLLSGYSNYIGSRFDNTIVNLLNGQIKVASADEALYFGGANISNVSLNAMVMPGHTDALIDANGAMVLVHDDTTVNLNIAGIQDGQQITVIGNADAASDLAAQLADGKYNFIEGGLISHDTSLTDEENLITTLSIKDPGTVIGGTGNGIGVGAAKALIDLKNATGDLAILRDKLLNAKTAEEAQQIAESISPNINGAAVFTAIQAAKQALGTTKIRIADVRAGQGGMAAGDGSNSTGAWVQAYGQSANQKNRGGIDGYKTSTYGFAVGADAEVSDNAIIGAAFSYANSDVKSQNVNRTKLDIDSYQFSVYGNYNLGMQAYVSGVVGYAFNKADQTRHNVGMIAGATATSNPDSNQFSAYVEGGKTVELGHGLNVTPNVSANYQHVSVDGHTERGFGGLKVNGYDRNMLELGVGAKLAMTHQMSDGATLTPSLDVGYRHDVLDDDVASTGSFTGGGATFSTNGLKPARGTFNVGVGVSYDLNNQWTVDAGYDFETKSDYRAHAGLVRAGYKF